jgi:DNA-binding beta-propeller fold protein YncE
MLRRLFSFLLCLMPPATLLTAQAPAGSLHLEREIPLPGVGGRLDHLAADVPGHRVFLAALGNGTIEVVDVNHGTRTAEIKGLKDPQGVAYAPSNGAVYVAGGGDGTVRSFDSRTLKPLHDIKLGEDADNLRLDAAHNQLLAGYGSGAIAVLSLDLAKKASFDLPAHPESFQFSPDKQRLFVNLPEARGIASVDLTSQQVSPAWSHPSAGENFSMAVDGTIHRLFIPCRKPARMLVINSDSGAITAWAPVVGDADDVFVDEGRRLVYVIGGEGHIDLFYVRAGDALVARAHVPTAPGARTGLYVPEWNKLLVAAPRQGTSDARLLVFSIDQ